MYVFRNSLPTVLNATKLLVPHKNVAISSFVDDDFSSDFIGFVYLFSVLTALTSPTCQSIELRLFRLVS